MNRTVLRLSVQAVLGRRRGLVLLLVPAALLVLAVAVRTISEGTLGVEATVGLGLTLALPIVALLAATAVLGPELDDGSIVYLLAKPVSRHVVALSKAVAAWATTTMLGALPIVFTSLVLQPSEPRRALALGVGAAAAGTVYTALFLALAACTRHAVVLGLLYTLLWEGVLGALLPGVRWLSVGAWGREFTDAVGAAAPTDAVGPAGPDVVGVGLPYAVAAVVLVTAGSVWLTGERLRSFTLRGEE